MSILTLQGQSADDRNAYFDNLKHAEKIEAVRRMKRDGYSEHSIAAATRLSVEAVRSILGEPNAVQS